MTEREAELMEQYYLECGPAWGREAAMIDNEMLSGVWRQSSCLHHKSIIREIENWPNTPGAIEGRRLFGKAYDEVIDFGIPPGGRHRE